MYYQKAIERPFSDLKKLVIGSSLFMVPYLNLILQFLGVGYFLECSRQKKLPEWTKLVKKFEHGVGAFAIAIVYLIPALLIGFITDAFNYLTAVKSIVALLSLPDFIFTLLRGITFDFTPMKIIIMLTFYFIPGALILYSKKYDFMASFDCKKLFKLTFKLKYLSAWVITLIYSVLIILAAGIISGLIPVVIPFIVQGMAFYILGVTIFALFSEVN